MKTQQNRRARMFVTAAVMASTVAVSAVVANPKGNRSLALQRPTVMVNQITSFYVRGGEQNRIMLSMLMGHNFELTTLVRQVTGDQVTPVVLSVSTLPDRQGFFDPALLSFEQNGKIWKPNVNSTDDLLPLTPETPFGGEVNQGQVHQGVFFIPAWFDTEASIFVNYGGFRYEARFIDKR